MIVLARKSEKIIYPEMVKSGMPPKIRLSVRDNHVFIKVVTD